MISWRNVQQSTARIARILINAPFCRIFLRSVLTAIITRVGGSIARNPQIATAGPGSEIGGLAGLSYTTMAARSLRSVFYELPCQLRTSP